MADRINISSNGNMQLVDPEDVSLVRYCSKEEARDGRAFYVITGKDNGSLALEEGREAVSIDTFIAMMADAGHALTPAGGRYFIAPKHGCYLTASNPDDDGRHGVLIGLNGAVTPDPARLTTQQLKDVVAALQACKPYLSFTPDESYSRWYKPHSLHIAPTEIYSLQEDGAIQLHAHFRKGGSLDLQVRERDNIELQALTEALRNNPTDEIRQAYYAESQKAKALEKQSLAALADKITAANPALVDCKGSDWLLRVTPESVEDVKMDSSRDSFTVRFKKSHCGAAYPDYQFAHYLSREAAEKGYAAVKPLLTGASKHATQSLDPKPPKL